MQKKQAADPGIACVLAAGNQLCVTIRDILQQLVVNNNACLVKLNPVNDWTGADMEKVLQPLIDTNMLRLVHGGAETAQVLLHTLKSCSKVLITSCLVEPLAILVPLPFVVATKTHNVWQSKYRRS